MNILFASPGYGIRSVGDDAMLVAIADGLRREDEDVEHACLVRHVVDEWPHYRKLGLAAFENFDHDSREEARGRRFLGFNRGDETPWHSAEMSVADVLVLGGGEVFLDITHGRWRGPVAYYELLVTLARFTGTPVVLAGASLPKLTDPGCIESTLFVLDNCDHVILRDHTSEANARALGFTGDIEVLPDPAIGLEPKEAKWIEPFFSDCKKPWIGVALRWCYWKGEDFDDVCDYWAGVCDTLAEELGGTIVFVPHNLYDVDDRRQDDRYLAQCVQDGMRTKSTSIEHYSDPREYLAVYKRLDLVVAVRHHGAVLGVRAGVPTVAVPYSEKTVAFVDDVGEIIHDDDNEDIVRNAVRRFRSKIPADLDDYRKSWYRYIEVINDIARR
jgi:polysaccharide pyruvyl transferase WcaK-like protein